MASSEFLASARNLAPWLSGIRTTLHQHPELSRQERETARLVAQTLMEMGLSPRTGVGTVSPEDQPEVVLPGNGVVVDLGQPGSGPTLLLRADMDALPIQEVPDRPHGSQVPGVMHACGHDAHVTCLLGAAKLLAPHFAPQAGSVFQPSKAWPGRVRLVFQPSEEVPPGGALGLIAAGVLEGVDAAAALHVFPSLPVGQVGLRSGTMLAFSDRFTLVVEGQGGHAARPHKGVDALAAAVQVFQALQYLVSRENDPLHPFVITVGQMNGGTAPNVLPALVTLEGTVRCLDPQVAKAMPSKIQRVADGVALATRTRIGVSYQTGYPALVNHEGMTRLAQAAAQNVLGAHNVVDLPTPEMGGEDFAYFAERVPAVFARLGVSNAGRGINHPLHHPGFDLDEDALPIGAAFLAQLAHDYLHQGLSER